MTTNPGTKRRFVWKENRLVSVRLRNGKFALLQLYAGKGRFAAFDIFRDEDEWDDVKLCKERVLFSNIAVRRFYVESEITVHKELKPARDLEYDEVYRISGGNMPKEFCLWQGTEEELTVKLILDGPNRLREMVELPNGHLEEKYSPLEQKDFERLGHIEMKGVRDYPELNERLLLCEMFGRNVDPMKELAFGRELPNEYRNYFEIRYDVKPLAELGY